MGTRLLSEHFIRNHCPNLRYVRVHSNGKNTATIYAWNDDLQLPDSEAASLKRYAYGYLLQNVCYQIKPYNQVQDDRIPHITGLPEPVIQAAMNRNLNQNRIEAVMDRMFPKARFSFAKYDSYTGTIYFNFLAGSSPNDAEKETIRQYLYELTPLGSTIEVIYG